MNRNRGEFDDDIPLRTLILSDDVDNNTVSVIMEGIAYINQYDDENEATVVEYEREPIKLIINSFGGSIYDGFALIGMMQLSKTPIHTYCLGSAMSMALLILASGHERYGHKLATFMYHECSDEPVADKLSTINENMEETKRLMVVYDTHLLSVTNFKKKQLDDIKSKKIDYYFSPQQALKFGLIDQIV